jgi:hypothetical protein
VLAIEGKAGIGDGTVPAVTARTDGHPPMRLASGREPPIATAYSVTGVRW